VVAGKDVRLKGEILACEKVVVDGDAEIVVSGCKHLQIGHSGSFRGTADVAEADIAGEFEGDLTVRERLSVRHTGRIKGTVRYGQIVIEAGGQITGDIATVNALVATDGTASGSGAARVVSPVPPRIAAEGVANPMTGEFISPSLPT
jgi:cytoskeletal protein CcmA (bactofilin family)